MSDDESEIPEHPEGLSFPEGGIQTIEGPNGHQRVTGRGARFIYAGFDELVKVVVEATLEDTGNTTRSYRAILRDKGGEIHLGGGGGDTHWIDIDYGWENALAQVGDFIESNEETKRENVSLKIVEGKEAYRKLRAQMN